MNFSDRDKMVLGAIIDYYLTTGETIGSRTLVKKYGIDLSSATIRNVMADLEDTGFIEKTHTSSGRVPTSKGYKYYLEALVKIKKLSEDEINRINSQYERRVNELHEILENTSRLLSKLSNYAGIVTPPDHSEEVLSKLELVHISDYSFMAVLVMKNGNVHTKKLTHRTPIDIHELRDLSQVLTDKLRSQKIDIVLSAIKEIISNHEKSLQNDPNYETGSDVMKNISKIWEDEISNELYIEGTPNIIRDIGSKNPENIVDLVEFFEDRSDIRQTLKKIEEKLDLSDEKVHVVLGDELGIKALSGLSLVFSVYNLGNSKGVIGVIGPKRMKYSKTISLVEYITHEVNKVIKKINDKGGNKNEL